MVLDILDQFFFFMVQQSRAQQRKAVQGTDGRDSTIEQMDQRMEFSLVEREC